MAPARPLLALAAFFTLIIIFVYFDPVVSGAIYDFGKDQTQSTAGDAIIDQYLNQWHYWVPMFIIAIFLFVITAGGDQSYQGRNIQ